MERNLFSTVYFENCANYYHVSRDKPDPALRIPYRADYYEVCFVLRGQVIHRHGDEHASLGAGDCFIIPPGFLHSVEEGADNTRCFWLSFQESLLFPGHQQDNLYRLLGALSMDGSSQARTIKLKVTFPSDERESLSGLFDCLIYECSSVPEQENNASLLIAAIISILARNYFKDPAMEKNLDHVNEYNAIMLDCVRYIDENYMKPLTISHMTKQFAMSSSNFSIMFPKVAGMPFKQYLNRKRISAAVALCADPTLPFHKIACMCGYLDISTFYRNFIKYIGVSPSSFRDNAQSQEGEK